MAKKQVGGFLFNVFNIGFTVVMFALPSVLLGYWYVYIRDPGGQKTQTVVVQQQPAASPSPSSSTPKIPKRQNGEPRRTSGIFSENPTGVNSISTPELTQKQTSQPTSQSANGRKPPTRSNYELRTWSDPSGKFTIVAKFYSATADKVKLISKDEKKLDVEIAKLSEGNKQYLRDLFKSKGMKAKF